MQTADQKVPAEIMKIEEDLLRLAAIVKFSDDAIIGMTVEGIIISWNPAAELYYGYSTENIKGQHFSNLIPPDYREEIQAILNKIRQGGHVDAFTTRRMRKDGAVIHLSTVISPFKDAAGQVTGAFIITRDITREKLSEEALAKERNLLRTVVDNLTDRLYVKDASGRYILDNPAHRQYLGVASAEGVIGKTVFDFFPTKIAEQYHADDVEIIRSGTPLLNREEPAITRQGEKILILTTKVPFLNGKGEVAGLVCLSRDITEAGGAPAPNVKAK